ncbi:hypothetical protein XA3_02200 [Xylocopilactobacillus apicola]|uniref:ATP-dependent DNA helicase RecG C-terminal domain-containing protein n=1 Tax=Xylocopilactobacillus apicola TaxID=2932184 RepID=A0AAU9CUU6_9LACO|nr:hypothetical protein XA3_02200 [Xylocopilactobacillus apicola]
MIQETKLIGPLPRILNSAKKTLTNQLRSFDPDRCKFSGEEHYPTDAWFEGLLNAVIHRSYRIKDPITIDIFDDHLKILSPGSFPEGITTENICKNELGRNPAIGAGIASFGGTGKGVSRIFSEMNAAGLPEPIYITRSDSVKLVLKNRSSI